MNIVSGTEPAGVGQFTAPVEEQIPWNLNEIRGSGSRRTFKRTINFRTPFTAPPRVIVALSRLDIRGGNNTTFRVLIDDENCDITTDNFTITYVARRDTQIYNATVSWIAFGTLNRQFNVFEQSYRTIDDFFSSIWKF